MEKIHVLNFYTYYLGIKKTKLKKLLDLTISKLSRKRKVNTIFYPEWRLDVFLARVLSKTIEHIQTDIQKQVVLVNNKPVNIHYVLSNKDFIRIWRPKSLFQKRIVNILEGVQLASDFIAGHISFPNLHTVCFLQSPSLFNLNDRRIHQRFVKKSHI
jgi:ribosomal 50S subunit-recycling heat shock protein